MKGTLSRNINLNESPVADKSLKTRMDSKTRETFD